MTEETLIDVLGTTIVDQDLLKKNVRKLRRDNARLKVSLVCFGIGLVYLYKKFEDQVKNEKIIEN